jgi:MFS family permease
MHFFSFYETLPLDSKQAKLSLWAVSWMSFFWSTSSLMVFSLLPIFITETLGASRAKLGLIEGVSVSLAFFSKVFSGVTSDVYRTRKPLIAIGSVLSILVKFIFAAASSVMWIFAARSLDRLSKGIRSSPTDALIADISQNLHRGQSYGLRQALYTLGGVFGALLATLLLPLTDYDYRLIFILSAIPACFALLLLCFLVKQPPIRDDIQKGHRGWQIRDITYLPPQFWSLLGVAFILMLARFSEAFVTLRARDVGWPIPYLPLLIVGTDLVHAGVVYPIGRLANRQNLNTLLLKGILVLILANGVFLTTHSIVGVAVGVLLAGLHMGMTQGLLATLVAESTPAELRGTAFAIYYFSSGIAVLIGNTLAGHLADLMGSTGCFAAGLLFTITASTLLFYRIRRRVGHYSVPH